jgi:hypothetical protein
MRKTILVIVMLCVAGACTAQEARQSSDARPSMPYSGTAEMLSDGTITLRLRLNSDGTLARDSFTYRVGDRAYDDVLRHLSGLRPGGTKSFNPWKD